ncbi:glucosylceramidase [Robertkochia marina]|uniref:Glucosylceramidase n=1 Tax=Robertkochia marina TaxID=1227945 RepID=A0A4S3M3A1_9FLAO|nr:glycoside hydrolase family 30 beta sandwich domain-containing protein [Robertkochia marina]THD69543.1 glucosylceramidase [Robertkochia marina]TRZ47199.1 glucosylceramidase [Robertkochia marina]
MSNSFNYLFILSSFCLFIISGCQEEGLISKDDPPQQIPEQTGEVSYWITLPDESEKLKAYPNQLSFSSTPNTHPNISLDPQSTFQQVDGFGFTLTGGSAQLINELDPTVKADLLKELFGRGREEIGISYLRISIGASDLDASVFSYCDLPPGEKDPELQNFSIANDQTHLIPVLLEILAINPEIMIMGSPWSAPVWMKDNQHSIGGSLLPEYYASYAKYFVEYIKAMKAEGIPIDAITPQNEPLHPGNNPSMYMTALQQSDFIKNHLGPAFEEAGLTTKIIIYDHNCDRPDYPISILNDADTRKYVNGSAFHLYGGDISALSKVHQAHPDKALYFTEQWTSGNGHFGEDLSWHTKNVIIGSLRNWSRVVLEWNMASDPEFKPHTEGGCTLCKGALTIHSPFTINRNVSYYIIAHASKMIPPGSVRIASTLAGEIHNVAFVTPENKTILIAVNTSDKDQMFNVKYQGKWFTASLSKNAVATFAW